MQAVQRRENNFEQDEDRFEIVDFQQTLQKCIEDEDKVYGAKNKPRQQEPTMFELLSWKDDNESLFNYTKKDKEVIESNPANKLKYKINKSQSHWVTENMDQFRKFAYSPSKKAVFFDLDDPAYAKAKLSASKGATGIPREFVETLGHTKEHDVYVKQMPEKASETIDKYTIQDLKSLPDVLKVIENRAISRGEVVKNPIAEKITERLTKSESKRMGGNYRGYEEEEADEQEGANQQQEPEEDVQVEKIDFSNVKSRLLQSKIKKAKELDPVYEKERLDRRKERIKRLNETTRWLPNSAFKTYFGRPPFENYGRGNINPTVGGSIYGDYLKSHNVNPHSGANKPEFKQVYTQADFAATRYPESQPEPPRKCKDDFRLSQNQVDELKRRNPLVPEKFKEESKPIIKPDLVNSLRFASEENTPDASFEEEKKSKKPKSLAESLKTLNKTAKAIRKEGAKQQEFKESKQRNLSEVKPKKTEKLSQPAQGEAEKAASSKKPVKESPKKTVSEKKQTTTKTKAESDQRTSTQKQVKVQERATANEEDTEFENPYRRPGPKTDEAAAQKYEQQFYQQRPQTQEGKGVKEIMQYPSVVNQKSPQTKTAVSFREAPKAKSAVKFKEASGHETHQELNYGKVEDLQTLLRETQKNEKIWERINEDTAGTVNVNPMEPPKNYLFTLSQKETDPRYYKNVPAVWLQRIPYAGVKNPKHEDVKEIFNYEC